MVRLQAIQTVISNADKVINYNQELSHARLDKIKAETELTRTKTDILRPNDGDNPQLVKIINLLTEEVDKEYNSKDNK